MGRMQAEALAAEDYLPLEAQLQWHLSSNHYPPVPAEMVPVCVKAIDLANEGRWEAMVELPEGILWRGREMSPVHAIVEQHHLDTWIIERELY